MQLAVVVAELPLGWVSCVLGAACVDQASMWTDVHSSSPGQMAGRACRCVILSQLVSWLLLFSIHCCHAAPWNVQEGKKLDLPVYFGDAGSPAVLHAVGAENAACAVR